MEKSKSWQVTANLILLLVVLAAPFWLPVRWLVFHDLLYVLCYVLGFIALALAVSIGFAEEISILIKMGSFAASLATILICIYFAFVLYSCAHMGGF